MIIPVLWFLAGLAALIAGAEVLVKSVSRLALAAGISKLVIGLTLVAFGTSAPELAVSIQAGINGETDLMIGNIIGSNISNTLLILGIGALLIPVKINVNLIRSDLPIMIGATLLVWVFALNGSISMWECLALSLLLFVYLLFLGRQSGSEYSSGVKTKRKAGVIVLQLAGSIAGFILLILGAGWMVDSAVIFAEIAGVSELVIGLTVVAIGTSLPEIVVVIVAAFRKERDIAVGSVIGSNIMNLLAVLGVSGLFIPGSIPVPEVLLRVDLSVLIAASFLCIPVFYTGRMISRAEGLMFLFFYSSYLAYLYLSNKEHSLLDLFLALMPYVFGLILLVLALRSLREIFRRYRFRNFNHINLKE